MARAMDSLGILVTVTNMTAMASCSLFQASVTSPMDAKAGIVFGGDTRIYRTQMACQT